MKAELTVSGTTYPDAYHDARAQFDAFFGDVPYEMVALAARSVDLLANSYHGEKVAMGHAWEVNFEAEVKLVLS